MTNISSKVALSGGSGGVAGSVVTPISLTTTTGSQTVTADNTTDTFTKVAHGLVNNDRVAFYATTLPTGILATTFATFNPYFVVNAAANTFQVSTTEGGVPLNFTTDGVAVYVAKLELIWSYDVPLQQMVVADWAMQTKTNTLSRRGYFLQDTCFPRSATPMPVQPLTAQTVNRVGDSATLFDVLRGINGGTAQIFVHGENGVTYNWVGYVNYRVI